MTERTKFTELKKVFKKLHGPKGCPWDKKQTHSSLLPYLKEESDEFIAEVRKKDYAHMQEELGDILLQVMFHSQIASKDGMFDVEDVIDTLIKKLKRRHPHVFGNKKVRNVKDVLRNWKKIKATEKLKK
jgi:tetrapyrrole methylase family protein / MazG family protein